MYYVLRIALRDPFFMPESLDADLLAEEPFSRCCIIHERELHKRSYHIGRSNTPTSRRDLTSERDSETELNHTMLFGVIVIKQSDNRLTPADTWHSVYV